MNQCDLGEMCGVRHSKPWYGECVLKADHGGEHYWPTAGILGRDPFFPQHRLLVRDFAMLLASKLGLCSYFLGYPSNSKILDRAEALAAEFERRFRK